VLRISALTLLSTAAPSSDCLISRLPSPRRNAPQNRGLSLRRLRRDSLADRIHEALQAADNGLTRKQIRGLFHGTVSGGRIDQALERLSSLGLVTSRFVPGRGRATTLWSAIDPGYADPMEEETAEPEESPLEAGLEAT
jgi:hypothetical protein